MLKKVFRIWVYVYAIMSFIELSTQNIVNLIENNIDEDERIDDGREDVYMTDFFTITSMNIRKIYLYSKRGL